jgi:hypothetical protein
MALIIGDAVQCFADRSIAHVKDTRYARRAAGENELASDRISESLLQAL